MTKFYLTPNAKSDLMNIALYTQQRWGEKQRRLYLKALDERFHNLANSPTKGKLRSEIYHNLRSYPEGKHVIYYLMVRKHVTIVNILHQRMEPSQHIKLK